MCWHCCCNCKEKSSLNLAENRKFITASITIFRVVFVIALVFFGFFSVAIVANKFCGFFWPAYQNADLY